MLAGAVRARVAGVDPDAECDSDRHVDRALDPDVDSGLDRFGAALGRPPPMEAKAAVEPHSNGRVSRPACGRRHG